MAEEDLVTGAILAFRDELLALCDCLHGIIARLHAAGNTTITPIVAKMGMAFITGSMHGDSDDAVEAVYGIITVFITHTHGHWEDIRQCDEEKIKGCAGALFDQYLKNAPAMSGFRDEINNLLNPQILKDEEKTTLLGHLNSLIGHACDYVHHQRNLDGVIYYKYINLDLYRNGNTGPGDLVHTA